MTNQETSPLAIAAEILLTMHTRSPRAGAALRLPRFFPTPPRPSHYMLDIASVPGRSGLGLDAVETVKIGRPQQATRLGSRAVTWEIWLGRSRSPRCRRCGCRTWSRRIARANPGRGLGVDAPWTDPRSNHLERRLVGRDTKSIIRWIR